MSSSRSIYVGCISGTSVDGLDIAAIEMDGGAITVISGKTYPIPQQLRDELLRLHTPGEDGIDRVGACDGLLGEFIGASVARFLADAGIARTDVAAIGSHGQTVRHRPPGSGHTPPFTLQIGDPSRIVESTGITTVADFRRRDMAAHGQGAPLVPPFHQALFAHTGTTPVVLNIGGIGNVSILGATLRGFDTGPGNALMDAWCVRHLHKDYDEGGDWARSGKCNRELLDTLSGDPFFAIVPPKSTGREYFTSAWLDDRLDDRLDGHPGDGAPLDPADVQATLAELTAASICQALARWAPGASNLIVCGGGRLNAYLVQRLAALAVCPVTVAEDWQVDGDSVEAAAFAWLAYRTLAGLPGNSPTVTGADGDRVLGAIYPA